MKTNSNSELPVSRRVDMEYSAEEEDAVSIAGVGRRPGGMTRALDVVIYA